MIVKVRGIPRSCLLRYLIFRKFVYGGRCFFEKEGESGKAVGKEAGGARRKTKWRKTEKHLAPLV